MGTIKRNFYNNITPTGKFDSADLTGTIPATNVADASLTNVTSVPASVGDLVQKVASDPTPVGAGDVWYNTTSNALKSVIALEAWSSASNMINARYTLDSGIGASQSDAIGAGGYGTTSLTEEYNGSGWTSGGNLNTARYYGVGGGIQTAAWVAGGVGFPPNGIIANTENYDGSSWTASGSLPTATRNAAATGSQTAGLLFGGNTPTPPAIVDATYEYDGSTWTTNPTGLNTARRSLGSAGTQTSALGFGGDVGPPSSSDATEEYDGSTWTSVNNLPGFQRAAGSGGTQTSAIYMGGDRRPSGLAKSTTTVIYDGTNWTTTANMGTGRYEHGGAAANNSAAVAFGGYITAATAFTEEYNKSTNVITAAAWASGGNLNTTRNQGNVAGSQTAGLLFGGETPPGATPGNTEEYNGSTWTTVNSMVNGRFDLGNGSAGTQTAALGAGGFRNDTGFQTSTEEYDGTSWTAGGALPAARYEHGVFGTQTAGVIHNGTFSGPSPTNTTLEYNGSTWASGGNTSVTGFARGGAGIISAGKAVGARTAPSTYTADVEDYDGTSWTAGVNFFRTLQNTATGGTQTATLVGNNPLASPSLYSATFDGTGWATAPSLATARQRLAGTTQLAIAASGSGSEEFTGETSAVNIVEITTS